MLFTFFRNRRRKRWLAEPVPDQWLRWLEEGVWHYRYLSDEPRARLHDAVRVLFHEKEWTGGRDFQVTDEMRVVIAGQAAILTLGFNEPYFFDRLMTVVVYPGPYSTQPADVSSLILGMDGDVFGLEAHSGESWQGGPIVLSWSVVEEEGRDGAIASNLVMHEFAHHLDSLDGETTGSPPMNDWRFRKRWYRVTDQEYFRLLRSVRRGQQTLLDHYGATNHAEFFAVSTECFFTRPHALARENPELHKVLCRLYGQDPCEWLPQRR